MGADPDPPALSLRDSLTGWFQLEGTQGFPASTRGYVVLVTWAEGFGPVQRVGIEGPRTYGSLRRYGKSDPIDAQAAARATLAEWLPPPKTREGHGTWRPCGASGRIPCVGWWLWTERRETRKSPVPDDASELAAAVS